MNANDLMSDLDVIAVREHKTGSLLVLRRDGTTVWHGGEDQKQLLHGWPADLAAFDREARLYLYWRCKS